MTNYSDSKHEKDVEKTEFVTEVLPVEDGHRVKIHDEVFGDINEDGPQFRSVSCFDTLTSARLLGNSYGDDQDADRIGCHIYPISVHGCGHGSGRAHVLCSSHLHDL